MRPTCGHVGAVAIIAPSGLVCSRCDAPIVADADSAEVSSVHLPPDAKNVDAFNRACRTGRVRGAFKTGRVWTCALEDWRARAPAGAPRGIAARQSKGATVTLIRDDEDIRRELGLAAS